MAKSKSFFGLRRGSTKTHTYQVFRGVQITKDRVYEVSNPQTSAQMEQRLKLPMVAQAASILKPIINHSFEGVEYGNESIKRFRQLNLKAGALTIRQYVPKGMINTGVANYRISSGSLAQPGKDATGLQPTSTDFSITNATTFDATAFASAAKGGTLTQEQIDAIKTTLYGLNEADQITIVMAYEGNSYSFKNGNGDTMTIPYARFVVSRLVFDHDRFNENNNWKFLSVGDNIMISNGYIDLTFGSTGNEETIISLGSSLGSHNNIMATAITSKKENDVWKRSNAYFVYTEEVTAITYEDVINTYLNSENATVSEKYLNNGSESVTITGGETSSSTTSN